MFNNKVSLNLLSEYRQELMGLAMLMVVFLHLAIPNLGMVIDFLHRNGGFGVDIFLLLSGMGLYYSTRNGINLKQFYYKRLIRIFPLYFSIVGICSIIYGHSFSDFILKATTIGYWTEGRKFDWFIPNIVALYILFPVFHFAIFKRKYGSLIGIIIVAALYIGASCLPYGSNFLAWLRWPVFFLGALVGKWLFADNIKQVGGAKLILLLILSIATSIWAYLKYHEEGLPPNIVSTIVQNGWIFRPFFFMVIPFSLFSAFLLSLNGMGKIRKFLSLIGAMSLEVYLLHIQFIILARNITNEYSLNKPIIGGSLVVVSFFVSYYVHKCNLYVTDKLLHKLR